jgi:protein-tyrosine phosphatase
MVSPAIPAFQRHLALDGTYNVRDTGGYRTQDGRITRWHTFWRADSLHRLSPAAQTLFLAHGVRAIIDLRRSDELQMAPNVFARSTQVTYHHLSLLANVQPAPGERRTLVDTYRRMLDERQEQLCAAFTILASPGGLPGVVHCTAGKDRTGLIVALMLSLVGVPEETIIADYALTAQYLGEPFLAETRQRALARGYTWEDYAPLVQCLPDFMHATLQYVTDTYGGIELYLRHIGLRETHIAALRTALVA